MVLVALLHKATNNSYLPTYSCSLLLQCMFYIHSQLAVISISHKIKLKWFQIKKITTTIIHYTRENIKLISAKNKYTVWTNNHTNIGWSKKRGSFIKRILLEKGFAWRCFCKKAYSMQIDLDWNISLKPENNDKFKDIINSRKHLQIRMLPNWLFHFCQWAEKTNKISMFIIFISKDFTRESRAICR